MTFNLCLIRSQHTLNNERRVCVPRMHPGDDYHSGFDALPVIVLIIADLGDIVRFWINDSLPDWGSFSQGVGDRQHGYVSLLLEEKDPFIVCCTQSMNGQPRLNLFLIIY